MTAALIVTYPAVDGATFDRDYYLASHLPLVRELWGPLGLDSATGYFPDGEGGPLAVAILTFADATTRDAALGSSTATEVFGDIPNFTDAQPVAVPLSAAA